MSNPQPQPGDLVVWHIPQIPGKAFRIPVASIEEGQKLCNVLADYDAFQFAERIKPDYCNAGGVQRWEDDGDDGFDWFDVDEDDEVAPR
jgi:hypothetical protein